MNLPPMNIIMEQPKNIMYSYWWKYYVLAWIIFIPAGMFSICSADASNQIFGILYAGCSEVQKSDGLVNMMHPNTMWMKMPMFKNFSEQFGVTRLNVVVFYI